MIIKDTINMYWLKTGIFSKETLVIVTADHSHTMSLGGYPGNNYSAATQ